MAGLKQKKLLAKLTPKRKHGVIILTPHHMRPYRLRHVGILAVALLFMVVLLLQVGGALGQRVAKQTPLPMGVLAATSTHINSSYGFEMSFDANKFQARTVSSDGNGNVRPVPEAEWYQARQLSKVTIEPINGAVSSFTEIARMTLEVKPEAKHAISRGLSASNQNLKAASYFAPTSDASFNVSLVSETADVLNTAPVYVSTYKLTPKFKGAPSYTMVWTGVVRDRPYAVTLTGLLQMRVPVEFQSVLDSIDIQSTQKIAGVSTSSNPVIPILRDQYLADAVSPSVVKLYHVVCGDLMIDGQRLLSDQVCNGVTGSGFFVRADGYVATNGHVVVSGAKDIFVSLLASNPALMNGFLVGAGLNANQIASIDSRPDIVASLMARVFDLPDDRLRLDNKQEITLVALGNQPLKYDTNAGPASLLRYSDSAYVKRAQLVGYNYSSKDMFAIQSGNDQGFTSSDVALLKINIQNAPALGINTDRVIPNQPLLLFGFPNEADNSLTDNSQLAVSVTDGTINSIRDAAGGVGRLYQSAAAASRGSSGGPAVTESGLVLGLMTYRVSGSQDSDASFSYVRDIQDVVKLAQQHNVVLSAGGATQKLWQEGLALYSQQHYSAAINRFADVKRIFPAQRLADNYISASQAAIAAGKDVPRVSVGLLVAGVLLCLAATGWALRLIIKHHAYYRLYHNHLMVHGHSFSA